MLTRLGSSEASEAADCCSGSERCWFFLALCSHLCLGVSAVAPLAAAQTQGAHPDAARARAQPTLS
jgi:hypothetical protein